MLPSFWDPSGCLISRLFCRSIIENDGACLGLWRPKPTQADVTDIVSSALSCMHASAYLQLTVASYAMQAYPQAGESLIWQKHSSRHFKLMSLPEMAIAAGKHHVHST